MLFDPRQHPEVINKLNDTDTAERLRAIEHLAFAIYENEGRDFVVKLLAPLFHDPNSEIRGAACHAIEEMGLTESCIGSVVNKLACGNPTAQRLVLHCITWGQYPESVMQPAIMPVMRLLGSDDGYIRFEAHRWLRERPVEALRIAAKKLASESGNPEDQKVSKRCQILLRLLQCRMIPRWT
jgi:hypothetical protein